MTVEAHIDRPAHQYQRPRQVHERPSNVPAEQALLGALIANNKYVEHVQDFLRPEHFYYPAHGAIYRQIIDVVPAGGVMDAVLLSRWIEADELCIVSDIQPGYAAELLVAMVAPMSAKFYAQEIVQCFKRRSIIEAAEDLLEIGFSNTEFLAAAPRAMQRLESQLDDVTTGSAVSLGDAVNAAVVASENARDGVGPLAIRTGFRSIDEFIGGFEPGTLNVLAGRPGMGKSALGHQIGINVARDGIGVLEISLEMTSLELGRRALSLASGVPAAFIKRGDLRAWQVDAVFKARSELRELPLYIEDSSGLTVAQIAAAVRAARRKNSVGLILVDHLHIVRPEDSDVRQGATWAIGRISGAMKRIAKESGCPVLLLAQLNRSVEGREDKRPALSDLRQAGEIEQDADSVAFVYRPEYYLPKSEPERTETETPERYQKRLDDYRERSQRLAGRAELIFAKVRDGQTGMVNLTFDGATTSFSDCDQ